MKILKLMEKNPSEEDRNLLEETESVPQNVPPILRQFQINTPEI
jgi:hypothetical protein